MQRLSWISLQQEIFIQTKRFSSTMVRKYGLFSVSYLVELIVANTSQNHVNQSDFVLRFSTFPHIVVFDMSKCEKGKEWEQAWEKHVQNYKDPCISSRQSHRCFKSSKLIMLMNEDKSNPEYHEWSDDHYTVCAWDNRRNIGPENMIILISSENDSTVKDSIHLGVESGIYAGSYNGIDYDDEGFILVGAFGHDDNRPCKIVSSNSSSGKLTIVYFLTDGDWHHESAKKSIPSSGHILAELSEVPALDVEFRNKPFTSDAYAPGAFRHYIGIPDELFPPLWRKVL